MTEVKMPGIVENGYCSSCGVSKAEVDADASMALCQDEDGTIANGEHEWSWNGCNVCDGDYWIMNDEDDSGPWRICPECNASGNAPSPFTFEPAE